MEQFKQKVIDLLCLERVFKTWQIIILIVIAITISDFFFYGLKRIRSSNDNNVVISKMYGEIQNTITAEIMNVYRQPNPNKDGHQLTMLSVKFIFADTEFNVDIWDNRHSFYYNYKDAETILLRIRIYFSEFGNDFNGIEILSQGYDSFDKKEIGGVRAFEWCKKYCKTPLIEYRKTD